MDNEQDMGEMQDDIIPDDQNENDIEAQEDEAKDHISNIQIN